MIEKLKERIMLIELSIKKGIATKEQKALLLNDLEELEKLTRVDRSEKDTLYFVYEYFSDDCNPDNEGNLIPAGVKLEAAPNFHIELCEILNVISNEEVNARIGWAAPRGHAKSAYLSNAYPIREIVFRRRKYILVISETDSMSKKFIEWIGQQLKYNVKLRNDFGELLSTTRNDKERDNQEQILTNTGTLIESASMGKQLRGKRNGSYRPDLVICDDLESSKNTNTPELREKNKDWFNKVVIPIGNPDTTAIIYMGTIVHGEGLLPHVLQRSDFKSKKFGAIIKDPVHLEYWAKFDELLSNQEDEDRLETAKNYYYANKNIMDFGSEVLWRQRWSYLDLMIERNNMGSRAFGSEFMNNPVDEESQIFKPATFQYFNYGDVDKRELDIFMAWDIALGKNNRSDYNAIVTVGRHRRNGIIHVLDAWGGKIAGHKAIEVCLEKIKEYKPRAFAVETVAAQFDFYRQLRDRALVEGIYYTKFKPINNRSKKEERIEQLEPLFENGAIRLMKHQRLLIDQLEAFPSGANDDLPDALQMAVDLCSTAKRKTFREKPKGL